MQLAHAADLVHQRLHGFFGVRIPGSTRILGVCYGQWVFLCAQRLDGIIEPLHLDVGSNIVRPQFYGVVWIRIRDLLLLRCSSFLLLLNRCGLGSFFLLLRRNYVSCTAAFREPAYCAEGSQQANLIRGLAVFFERVWACERQAGLRPLQHLLRDLRGDLGQSADACAFGKNCQQPLVGQLGCARSTATQQRLHRDTGQLLHQPATKRDQARGHIQTGLRDGSGQCAT